MSLLQFSNPLFHIAVPPTPKIKNPKLLIPQFTRNKYLHDLQVVKCSKEDHQVIGSPLVHGKYTHNLTLDAIPPPSPLPNYDVSKEYFPDDFLFGASTSALQTEGRGCEGGRGKGTWDSMIEADKGRKAVDSYNLYKEDVKLLKEMGMNLYRFSISWSRILPDGTIHSGINQEGINFYNKLIDELLDNGITPMITLMHFDLPQAIQDEFGGFLSPNISTHFKEYANLCFQEFGDRVKYWETINEPLIYAYLGKKMGFPPQLQTEPNSVYTAYHNIILAHSVAAKLYKQRYQKKQGGKIGVSLPIQWSMPFSDDPKDLAATEASVDLTVG